MSMIRRFCLSRASVLHRTCPDDVVCSVADCRDHRPVLCACIHAYKSPAPQLEAVRRPQNGLLLTGTCYSIFHEPCVGHLQRLLNSAQKRASPALALARLRSGVVRVERGLDKVLLRAECVAMQVSWLLTVQQLSAQAAVSTAGITLSVISGLEPPPRVCMDRVAGFSRPRLSLPARIHDLRWQCDPDRRNNP